MKKILLVILSLVCGVVFSDSYAEKPRKVKMSDDEVSAKLDSLRIEKDRKDSLDEFFNDILNMPCLDESYGTVDGGSREWGFADGRTKEEAIEKASRDAAKEIISKRIIIHSTDELTVEKDSITEEKLSAVLTNYEMMCLGIDSLQDGVFRAYVVIRLPNHKPAQDEINEEEIEKAIRKSN